MVYRTVIIFYHDSVILLTDHIPAIRKMCTLPMIKSCLFSDFKDNQKRVCQNSFFENMNL